MRRNWLTLPELYNMRFGFFYKGDAKHPAVCAIFFKRCRADYNTITIRGGKSMAANQKIRIKLKAYDHVVLDQSAEKIVEIKSGS